MVERVLDGQDIHTYMVISMSCPSRTLSTIHTYIHAAPSITTSYHVLSCMDFNIPRWIAIMTRARSGLRPIQNLQLATKDVLIRDVTCRLPEWLRNYCAQACLLYRFASNARPWDNTFQSTPQRASCVRGDTFPSIPAQSSVDLILHTLLRQNRWSFDSSTRDCAPFRGLDD